MSKWTPLVNAAQSEASRAAGPWNKRASQGKPFTDAMGRAYDQGNRLYHAAQEKHVTFSSARKYASDAGGVERTAGAAIDAYGEARDEWRAQQHVVTSG